MIGEELEMLNMLNNDNVSFAGKFDSQASDLELSTNSHLNIDVKEFNIGDYYEIMQKLKSGDIHINVMATGIVMRTFVKILE